MQVALSVNGLNCKVWFKKGNISICSGGWQNYSQVDQIIIQHEEV